MQNVKCPYQRGGKGKARRGVAVILVLLLLAMTLSLSYASMRSQGTSALINRNYERQRQARENAALGLRAAWKKIHQNDWSGVSTPIVGTLGSFDSYRVEFSTGDEALISSDSRYPYRLTILSIGYSRDPNNAQCIVEYRARAVGELLPRQIASEPSSWSDILNHTLYQWSTGSFWVDYPVRIEGAVRMQGLVWLFRGLNWLDSTRSEYLCDLLEMKNAGKGDKRPFTGPITYSYNLPYFDVVTVLTNWLGLTVSLRSASSITFYDLPFNQTSYQLYKGGKFYTIPQLSGRVAHQTLGPDPATNPLGFFRSSGTLTFGDNLSFRGFLIAGDDVLIDGTSIDLSAADLPSVWGETNPIQLPLMLTRGSIQVRAGSRSTASGIFLVQQDFTIASDVDGQMETTLKGKVVAKNFFFMTRSNWNLNVDFWNDSFAAFQSQSPVVYAYLPEYMQEKKGLSLQPAFKIAPATSACRYHWHNWQNPLYIPHGDDGGLRRNLIEWHE